MPELPEVERAAALLRSVAVSKTIVSVETVEDTIVFTGTTHTEFAAELTGRKVTKAGRYGKVFYLELDGEGKMPVMHFGMTGMLQVKGELPTYYRKKPTKPTSVWPPKGMKFILHLSNDSSSEVTQIAFMDVRRLGRIRLCASPTSDPPIGDLGFDPILSMPPLVDFSALVLKRACPIKALLLDQSFSAGVGNWVADEILYHSRVHPEQRCNTLSESQIRKLHHNTKNVCEVAVEANADDTKFPDDWLFKHRWGKGKKIQHTMKLPSGGPATIKWLTVGGRTSAFVAELQKLPGVNAAMAEDNEASDSDLTPLSGSDTEDHPKIGKKRKAPAQKTVSRSERVKATPPSKKRKT
ncbi:hypothetical protein PLICRDRAFT_36669 [Plicaturopsis crispa FD-325 SS-3]|nr:hypothetical protein PLICRDRAFT_36669 [Plicaturopsis crispa FD-325 SS-3]